MIPEKGIIFDAGTGMYRARDLLQTETLRIFLSHAHLDHCIGITFLFDVLWEKDVSQVIVYSEPEKIAAIKEHLFNKTLFPAMPDIEFRAYDGAPIEFDDVTISTFPLKHPGGSIGFRMEGGGKSIGYVTDTIAHPTADYVDQIRDLDLLVHECYFPDGWEERAELTGHSCLSPVCQVAKASNAGELILVHINPLDENADWLDLNLARSIFPKVTVAEDKLVIPL